MTLVSSLQEPGERCSPMVVELLGTSERSEGRSPMTACNLPKRHGANAANNGGSMPDIDGSYDTPQGRKVFVRARPGETSDDFAERAMGMLTWAGDPFADGQDEPPQTTQQTDCGADGPGSPCALTASGDRTCSRVRSPSYACGLSDRGEGH